MKDYLNPPGLTPHQRNELDRHIEGEYECDEGDGCSHKRNEDCMYCLVCGRCREDLNDHDVCSGCYCGPIEEGGGGYPGDVTTWMLALLGIGGFIIVTLIS